MHIIACIKAVVSAAPGGNVVRSADNCALNPFDRPALEAALRLKAAHDGSVTVLSMGPSTTAAVLREALALGADRAVLLCDPALAGSDTLATSTALCAAVQHLAPFDLLLFGTRSADSDTGQVGPQTAVLLDIPMLAGAVAIDWGSGRRTITRQMDGFQEVYEVTSPAALSIHPDMARPRDPSLAGLATAFDAMPVEILGIDDVGLAPAQVGDAGSPTRVLGMQAVSKNRTCQWIEGTPSEQADALVRQLADANLIAQAHRQPG